jgi:chloramphenicol-sensitive protein RarD
MNRGILYSLSATVLWGILPIYWKWLHRVPAFEALNHRIVWSVVTLVAILAVSGQWKAFWAADFSRHVMKYYVLGAALIAFNWGLYIWSVMNDRIAEAALGYFINPLLSVLMGVVFFHERLRRLQWAAIGIAAAGVAYLTWLYGRPPLVALGLALSFGLYSMVKKKAPLGSFFGLTIETGILLLPALGYLVFEQAAGRGAFLHSGGTIDLLLIGSGAVTSIPLLLFSAGVRRIPLSALGIIQYVGPTIQFLIGVMAYHEPFVFTQFIGYSIVWTAVIVYIGEGILSAYARRSAEVVVWADEQ